MQFRLKFNQLVLRHALIYLFQNYILAVLGCRTTNLLDLGTYSCQIDSFLTAGTYQLVAWWPLSGFATYPDIIIIEPRLTSIAPEAVWALIFVLASKFHVWIYVFVSLLHIYTNTTQLPSSCMWFQQKQTVMFRLYEDDLDRFWAHLAQKL